MKLNFLLTLLLSGLFTCKSAASGLITENATTKTQALYINLKELAKTNIMFGHQETNHYGHAWANESDRSDVKDVCGSYPAIYGHDFSAITNLSMPAEERSKEEEKLRNHIIDAYNRGGINTISWHLNSPVNGGSFYYKENPVETVVQILPGGEFHDTYKDILRIIASFANNLKDQHGDLIPVIFRPYHECDGDWFWWGTPYHCTRAQFFELWKFTIDFLRDTMGVTNFIYVFSPDCRFTSAQEYLSYYLGDEYVDIIGMDNYWDLNPNGGEISGFTKKLKIISDLAIAHHKVAALTETGREGIPEKEWWTKTLLPLLRSNHVEISYLMVWRNAYQSETHFYAPFPGQISADDFIKFRKDGYILFENDLPDMYTAQ